MGNYWKKVLLLLTFFRNDDLPVMIFVTTLLSMFIMKFYEKWKDQHVTNHLGALNIEASNELSNNELAVNRLEKCNIFIALVFDCYYSYYSPSHENLSFYMNPNIGPDGKNNSIVSPTVAKIASVVFCISFVPLILVEEYSVDLGHQFDMISFLFPTIFPTFFIPIMFYITTPKSFAMIKEIVSDMF